MSCQGVSTVLRRALVEMVMGVGPVPTLMTPAAKSPYGAVIGISAKEGSPLCAAVSAVKSIHGISAAPCQKGYSLTDAKKRFTMPEHITTSQLLAE